MIKIHLEPRDLEQVRFGISPLAHLISGLRVMLYSSPRSVHAPWASSANAALEHLDLGNLRILIRATGYVPDFLLPPPTDGTPSFDTELQRLRSTSPEQIQLEVSRLLADSPTSSAESLTSFIKHPKDAVIRLADLLELCWSLILEPYWLQIRRLCEADIMPRATKLTLGDTASVLNELHPITRFFEGTLELHRPLSPGPGWLGPPEEVALAGRGLLLVPEVFAWPRISVSLDGYWQPSLYYSPRGAATLWGGPSLPPGTTLELVLGKQCAKVLLAVSTPRTTQDIARELKVTTGNVSHHLGRLRRAGLIDMRRESRLLFYSLNAKGETLLELLA